MESLRLGELEFEWDDAKAQANWRKHGVSFREAATAFLDQYAEMMPDPDHSEEEDRFILLAESIRLKVLMVVHVARGVRLRIISARAASPSERRRYVATRIGRR